MKFPMNFKFDNLTQGFSAAGRRCTKDVAFAVHRNRNGDALNLGRVVEFHFHKSSNDFVGQHADLVPGLKNLNS